MGTDSADTSDARVRAYQQQAGTLVGEKIRQVRYYQVGSDVDLPDHWLKSNTRHELDYGVEIECFSGKQFMVKWDNAFGCWGLELRKGRMADKLKNSTFYDVTEYDQWPVDKTVRGVTVYWVGHKAQPLPQDIMLSCSDRRRIYLSSQDSDCVYVYLTQELAKQHAIGPFGEWQKKTSTGSCD